jgi:hypothetical protein
MNHRDLRDENLSKLQTDASVHLSQGGLILRQHLRAFFKPMRALERLTYELNRWTVLLGRVNGFRLGVYIAYVVII